MDLTRLSQVHARSYEENIVETVNIYEAKSKLSQLVAQAAAGEDVIIGRSGKPVARLTQIEEKKRVIRFGLLKGKIKIAKDFDAPLPHEVIAAFEGR
jgi:prevent-host-death family protein